MPDSQPENPVLQILRDMREKMATKGDVAELRAATKEDMADLRSKMHSLRADVASNLHQLDKKVDVTRKELSEQIVGLRRAVVEYHSAVIGRSDIVAGQEARKRRARGQQEASKRRVEQRLGLDEH